MYHRLPYALTISGKDVYKSRDCKSKSPSPSSEYDANSKRVRVYSNSITQARDSNLTPRKITLDFQCISQPPNLIILLYPTYIKFIVLVCEYSEVQVSIGILAHWHKPEVLTYRFAAS